MIATTSSAAILERPGEPRSPSSSAPAASATAMSTTLNYLFEPDEVVELRAIFSKDRKRTDCGYFDAAHRNELVSAAVNLNKQGAAVYMCMNTIDPQLLSRYSNRVERYAKTTTADHDVIRRRWLLLDFDPVRPKDTSATDAQVALAKDVATKVYKELKAGWPDPAVAESGNGYHLLYPIDLANDSETTELIKGALEGLAKRFDTDNVKLDRVVYNAARITKLYGIVANKGDHTPATPWRLSQIIKAPERQGVVTVEQLRAWVPQPQGPHESASASGIPFDLIAFLSRLGIEYTQDMHGGAERYLLAHCPFDADHGKGEAAVFRNVDGVLGFKCQHASCTSFHWQDLRALVDGRKEQRSRTNRGQGSEQDHPGQTGSTGSEWPEPDPLSDEIDALPYPIAALPTILREAAIEVQSFVQSPYALVASSALSTLSVASQGLANVKRDSQLSGPISVYLLVIADSGERKTKCDKFFGGVVRNWEDQQREAMAPQVLEAHAALAAFEARKAGISDAIKRGSRMGKDTESDVRALRDLIKNPPAGVIVPRLLFEDATPEQLAFLLATGWPSGGILSAEAGTVFGAHGMSNDTVLRNLSLLNVLWDGGEMTVDRRTKESFRLRGRRLSFGLMVQASAFQDFLDRAGTLPRGTGFLSRFLPTWPPSTQGERLYKQAPEALPALERFANRIRELLNTKLAVDLQGCLTPVELGFTKDAHAIWAQLHDDVELELGRSGKLRDVKDVAAKAAENVARLAAQFHLMEHGLSGAIGPEHITQAGKIVAWHLTEAIRIFAELDTPRLLLGAMKLDAWLRTEVTGSTSNRVALRRVRQYGPGCVRQDKDLRAAMTELNERGRARVESEGTKRFITLNPALMRTKP